MTKPYTIRHKNVEIFRIEGPDQVMDNLTDNNRHPLRVLAWALRKILRNVPEAKSWVSSKNVQIWIGGVKEV